MDQTPSGAWLSFVQRVYIERQKIGEEFRGNKATVSGPEFYGLANRYVQKGLEFLPHAEECTSYEFRHRTEGVQRILSPSRGPAEILHGKRRRSSSRRGSSVDGDGDEGGDNDENVIVEGDRKKRRGGRRGGKRSEKARKTMDIREWMAKNAATEMWTSQCSDVELWDAMIFGGRKSEKSSIRLEERGVPWKPAQSLCAGSDERKID
eukprot:TRINITY_DN1119_c1_g1_i1.p1 TRINITY_DN1119_c1_g1~~TRINITY_DN1119_c1_g1_i1.p1  ORF type:complete len:207 (-),score=60.56 TRINITY_DN1119_c1_g1_i1:157-777(-)